MRWKYFALVILLLCFTNNVVAEVISLPKTGQNDDGPGGIPLPEPRFTLSNDNLTVTDNLTGLIWTKNANLTGNRRTWQQMLSYIANMNATSYAGRTDWRMPNINELLSLVDHGRTAPALTQGHPFTNVQATYPYYYYFSSTTIANQTAAAGVVEFDRGSTAITGKTSPFNVWPVCGESTGPAKLPKTWQKTSYATGDDGNLQKGIGWDNRFTDNGDSTVTDNLTGLMWTKNSQLTYDITWLNAVSYVNGMNAGTNPNFGHTDWRIPNINELKSLMDMGRIAPALPVGHPFTNVSNAHHWTSTTLEVNSGYAWHASLWWGEKNYTPKNASYITRLWAVRSVAPSEGFLFPLDGVTAYTAPVSSVMDHSMITPYTKDGVVLAFNGEEGYVNNGCWCYSTNSVCDPNNYTNCAVAGFKSVGGTDFLDNVINYDGKYLYYDGHPGYDYPTPTGTDIHAPESGTLCVATTTTQKPQPADVWRNTTKCPLSSVVITNWSSHHTFYIIHKNVLLNSSIDDYMTVFLHNDDLETLVRSNIEQNGYATVTRSQHVAESGEFGSPGAQHMHMETYKWNRATSAWDRVDPYGNGVDNILWGQN